MDAASAVKKPITRIDWINLIAWVVVALYIVHYVWNRDWQGLIATAIVLAIFSLTYFLRLWLIGPANEAPHQS
jgi:DMSO/TMAO reductase YedYZ heme-binding membrane subunit